MAFSLPRVNTGFAGVATLVIMSDFVYTKPQTVHFEIKRGYLEESEIKTIILSFWTFWVCWHFCVFNPFVKAKTKYLSTV